MIHKKLYLLIYSALVRICPGRDLGIDPLIPISPEGFQKRQHNNITINVSEPMNTFISWKAERSRRKRTDTDFTRSVVYQTRKEPDKVRLHQGLWLYVL